MTADAGPVPLVRFAGTPSTGVHVPLPTVVVISVNEVQLATVSPPAASLEQVPNSAQARPLTVSRSVTAALPVGTRDQDSPPSSVAHRSGPNAQPCSSSANRMPLTPGAFSGPSATGAGRPLQVWPPSCVRATEVQIGEFCWAPQWPAVPAGPITQPRLSE